ncbi:MAG: hypothetical protein HYV09_22750 [Deltaproteobacteria bacterium]|nr:hypothetical protein [Deltaproteobacteria bacterium]
MRFRESAFVVSALVLIGCSSGGGYGTADGGPDGASEGGSNPFFDASTKTDTSGFDSAKDTRVAPPPDVSTPDYGVEGAGLGDPCATEACVSPGICSNTAFTSGGLYATPVCIETSCTLSSSDPGKACGVGYGGICISAGSGALCLPRCEFSNSTAAPTGCVGKNLCFLYVYTRDPSVAGLGYCLGGCRSDADCTGGDRCQVEDALCVKSSSYYTYTKTIGTACSSGDTSCNCITASAGTGYCSKVCRVGEAGACPTGYTCDPDLPKSDSSGALFSALPYGMGGYCLKNCTYDTDCPNSTGCRESGGTGRKTCHVTAAP